jgi:hypothetical protein
MNYPLPYMNFLKGLKGIGIIAGWVIITEASE